MENSVKLVAIALGSNLGDKLNYLKQATVYLSELNNIKLLHSSSIYESDSFGFTSESFLNNVLLVECNASPEDLLSATQNIEKQLGRNKTGTRNKKYCDRTIDIDIIFYGNMLISSSDLILPHPEVTKRNFVLLPLIELKQFHATKSSRFMQTIVKPIVKNGVSISIINTHKYLKCFNHCKTEHNNEKKDDK